MDAGCFVARLSLASGKVARRSAIHKMFSSDGPRIGHAITQSGAPDTGAMAEARPSGTFDGSKCAVQPLSDAVQGAVNAVQVQALAVGESKFGGGGGSKDSDGGGGGGASPAQPPDSPETPLPRRLLRQRSMDKFLDLRALDHAVIDLGVYPSHQEVEVIPDSCGDAMRCGSMR